MLPRIQSTLQTLAIGDPLVFAETILQRYGLKVIGHKTTDPLATKVQVESIVAMASVITEDIDDCDIHPARLEVKRLAEDHGYIVKVLEETGVGTADIAMAPGIAPAKPRTRPRARPKRRKQPDPTKSPEPRTRGYEVTGEAAGGKYRGILITQQAEGLGNILESLQVSPTHQSPAVVILKSDRPWLGYDGQNWTSLRTNAPVDFGAKKPLFEQLCGELGLSRFC